MSNFENDPSMERLMQLPRAYEVTHAWGRLIVSAAAHEAYGLVPLHEPSAAESVTAEHELDVILLSPSEHSVSVRILAPDVYAQSYVSPPHITAQRGIQIACSFGQDRESMLEASLNKYAELHDVDPRHLIDTFVTEEEKIPIGEHLDQRLNTVLAHAIHPGLMKSAYIGYRQLKNPLLRWLSSTDINSELRARAVADDVHRIYCSDCFNQKFGETLKD